MTPKIEHCWK